MQCLLLLLEYSLWKPRAAPRPSCCEEAQASPQRETRQMGPETRQRKMEKGREGERRLSGKRELCLTSLELLQTLTVPALVIIWLEPHEKPWAQTTHPDAHQIPNPLKLWETLQWLVLFYKLLSFWVIHSTEINNWSTYYQLASR